ncbi:acyltransferase family protein [Reichenbachiella versicolor]|uniref:acyltransferase family protein n=1 Tax=Reichenbachiella versicolor TaxID=1821036 RepID=UPI000D6E8A45|nr:heparan-alpha-glucosaminide N-acetyltransferase domain-containing protein [Reichenbachiella versicolor]
MGETKKRLVELDVLRGVSVFGMILVITPGSWGHRFEWTNHAEWQGYPLSDMIFPSFLFCVGMSIALSFNRRNPDSIFQLILKVFKRTLALFIIGIVINGFPYYDLENIRIPGILQRIALSYMIVTCFWIVLQSKQVNQPIIWLSIVSVLILAAYYVLLYYIPVPGIGVTGDSPAYSWPSMVDQQIFGINHLWKYGVTDDKVTYDPEGILATFPASVNVVIGLIIGLIYTRYTSFYTSGNLIILGGCLLIIGVTLDYTSVAPSIKKIWSSSFVLLSGGFSLLLFVMIKLVLEKLPKTRIYLQPFIVYGGNAIIAFALSNMLVPIFDLPIVGEKSMRYLGFEFFNSFIYHEKWSSMSFAIAFLIILFLPLRQMYKRRIFLKL